MMINFNTLENATRLRTNHCGAPPCKKCGAMHSRTSNYCAKCDPVLMVKCGDCKKKDVRKSHTHYVSRCNNCLTNFRNRSANE